MAMPEVVAQQWQQDRVGPAPFDVEASDVPIPWQGVLRATAPRGSPECIRSGEKLRVTGEHLRMK